jgi:hypothetical protein
MLEAFCANIPRGKQGGHAIRISSHGRGTVFHKPEVYERSFPQGKL